MSKIKLKPCPFCGEKDDLKIGHDSWGYPNECYSGRVRCGRCDSLTYAAGRNTIDEAEADAVKRWNTRAKEQEA